MEKEKYPKASYPEIFDYTKPKFEEIATQTCEIEPEHKIVVELAGQWPDNSAYLYLSKTKMQCEKIKKPQADLKTEHRSIAEFNGLENEAKHLYLIIPGEAGKTPVSLLLAENIMPVSKGYDMPEWDTVLVPVIPMYPASGEKDPEKAKLYDEGYIYILRSGKVWREIKVNSNGYFSEVNLLIQGDLASMESTATRHLDISLMNEETGTRYSFDLVEIYENGEFKTQQSLDGMGNLRVINLTSEEVEVVLPTYEPARKFTFATKESPRKGGKATKREPDGRVMPHIWLPYKVNGVVETLHAAHFIHQQSASQLQNLEKDYKQLCVEITGLDSYSKNQCFVSNDTTVKELTMPDSITDKDFRYSALRKQVGCNVAQVILNPPIIDIRFKYYVNAHIDQPDDYFELIDVEGQWSQRRYLRSCDFIGDKSQYREICFSGWHDKVEKVSLIRSSVRNENFDPVVIYKEVTIASLLAGSVG
ncbi:hypothetical protein [Photobacterium galatheae]|uniref:Uncharacterized protein n=1 Tax=Photobacterium galatheae TaxID=1654360 RepID=A0A066RUZ6_9GAMM|nr:hypothetical protein [Photobacterium galatheae]KDM91537.1 hypothetical protein EA58_10965 [Photobacterium galatheae]MCM0149610.1 hypothetical protein [Photobacterium galatheae]